MANNAFDTSLFESPGQAASETASVSAIYMELSDDEDVLDIPANSPRLSISSRETPSSPVPVRNRQQSLSKTRITSLRCVYGPEDYVMRRDSEGVYYELNPDLEFTHYLQDVPNVPEEAFYKKIGRPIRETHIHSTSRDYEGPKNDFPVEAFKMKPFPSPENAFKPGSSDPTLAPAYEYDFDLQEFVVAKPTQKEEKKTEEKTKKKKASQLLHLGKITTSINSFFSQLLPSHLQT